MRAVRLVVVSANLLTRAGIQQVAAQSQSPRIEVAAALSDFKSLRKTTDEGNVDVVFIDDTLPPNTNLVRIIQSLVKDQPVLAVIVTLNRPTKSLIQQLLDSDVRGIMDRSDDLEHLLVQAILLARQRGLFLSPSISRLVDVQRPVPSKLSQQDLDVLRLLADGLEPKGISAALGVHSSKVYRVLRTLRDLYGAHSNEEVPSTHYAMRSESVYPMIHYTFIF